MSISNEQLYNKLRLLGLNCLELPEQHLNLVRAFNERSKRIRNPAWLEIQIGDHKVDQVVLLSFQLLTDAILGLDFLFDHEAEPSFRDRKVSLMINNKSCQLGFPGVREATKEIVAETSFKKQVRNLELRSALPCATPPLSADPDIGQTHHSEYSAAVSEGKIGAVNDGQAHTSIYRGRCLLIDNVLPHREHACDAMDDSAKYEMGSRQMKRGSNDALEWNKERRVADNIDNKCTNEMYSNENNDEERADDTRLCLTTSYFERNYARRHRNQIQM